MRQRYLANTRSATRQVQVRREGQSRRNVIRPCQRLASSQWFRRIGTPSLKAGTDSRWANECAAWGRSSNLLCMVVERGTKGTMLARFSPSQPKPVVLRVAQSRKISRYGCDEIVFQCHWLRPLRASAASTSSTIDK